MLQSDEGTLKELHLKTREEEGGVDKEAMGYLILSKRVIKNPAVKTLGQQAIQHLSGLYNTATSRIKNDKIRRALQSDTGKHLLNSATNRLQ